MPKLIFWLTAVCIPTCLVGEMFSATAQLAQLIGTQKTIVEKLDNFISKKEEIFNLLKNFRNNFKAEYDEAQKNIDQYVQNPINAYTLIKRLTLDINDIGYKLDVFGLKTVNKSIKYPTEEDLIGASESIVRLQETYHLKTSDLAAGKIYNKRYSSPMTSSDCFELGRALHDKKQYYYSNLWFLESLKKFDSMDWTLTKSLIYEYLAFNSYEMNDLEESLKWTEKMLEVNPKQEDWKERESELQKEIIEKLKAGEETSYKDLEEKKQSNIFKTDEDTVYEGVCRGDYQLPANYTKRLACHYDAKGHPYLKIAPFKVEEMYLDPYITVYHDVISDDEIRRIIKLAMQKDIDCIETLFNSLVRSKLEMNAVIWSPYEATYILLLEKLERGIAVDQDEDGNRIEEPSNDRVSQVGWLLDTLDDAVARVSRRAGHMARLTINTAEMLQANTYGIGGHYVPHYDMVPNGEKCDYPPEDGNRMATVLFYMSDVLQGGGTAFIDLGISVQPKKGSAVVWRNLLPSTEPDLRTRHAACPVILGSKWVCNKWLHAGGQEFVAPCNLEYQRQDDMRVTVAPILSVSPT